MSDAAIVALTDGCSNLVDIDLVGTSIGDTSIIVLSERCQSLSSLNLTECDNVTDVGLSALGRGCPHLTTLKIMTDGDMASDKSMIPLALAAVLH